MYYCILIIQTLLKCLTARQTVINILYLVQVLAWLEISICSDDKAIVQMSYEY